MSNYNQTTPEDIFLTAEQQKEIISRDADFINGKTKARDWEDIKQDIEKLLNNKLI